MSAGLFDPDPQYDEKETSELLRVAADRGSAYPARARSLTALGRRLPNEASLYEPLATFASARDMQEERAFGLISLAFIAVGGLTAAGTPESTLAARNAMRTFSPRDREALVRFLKSGDFPVPSAE